MIHKNLRKYTAFTSLSAILQPLIYNLIVFKHSILVSVIISTYNRSNVLKYAISSVINQTYQHFEIIVIGDHCTDDTEEVVCSFTAPRITFYNLEENFGEQSYPNNVGYSKSKGGLIAWLNHDDLWYPEHLETLVNELSQTDSGLVYSWYLPYNWHKLNRTYNLPVFTKDSRYYPFFSVPASTWLVKREVVEEVGPWKSAWEIYNIPSQDWINRVHKAGKKITPVNKLSVIAIQSGMRKNSYSERQEEEHEWVFKQIYTPEFREKVLTELCQQIAYRFNRLSFKEYILFIVKKPVFFLAMKYQFNPHLWAARLTGLKKGGRIGQLRKIRGLPALKKK